MRYAPLLMPEMISCQINLDVTLRPVTKNSTVLHHLQNQINFETVLFTGTRNISSVHHSFDTPLATGLQNQKS